MNRNTSVARPSPCARQAGAALVVAMILLIILTLLAISGMTTSTTELQMAGNEQYTENAFQAAETGIERTIANGAFDVYSQRRTHLVVDAAGYFRS